MTYHDALRAFQRGFVTANLHAHQGRRVETARAIGLSRSKLFALIVELGIDVPAPPPVPMKRGARGRFTTQGEGCAITEPMQLGKGKRES